MLMVGPHISKPARCGTPQGVKNLQVRGGADLRHPPTSGVFPNYVGDMLGEQLFECLSLLGSGKGALRDHGE
jgi:hypothetical protein